MTITELVERAHATAKSKGWWENRDPEASIPELIALMHSELSEALESFRSDPAPLLRTGWHKGQKPEGFGVELADCVIRIADACGALNIDLEAHITEKMAYNETRPHRHGGKRV